MERLWASIPKPLFEELEQLAEAEDRPVSNLIAFIVERHIRDEREARRQEAMLARR